MPKAFPYPIHRWLTAPLAVAALFFVSGCVDDPIHGDDFRTVYEAPHALHQAFIYSSRNAARDADRRFGMDDRRLYAAVGFGAYYPGCGPGVGEKIARRYGSVVLTDTGKPLRVDVQEYAYDKTTVYAAAYNAEIVRLLGADNHPYARP